MRGKARKHTGLSLALAVAAVFSGLQLAGCGGAEEALTTAQKEFVYVPEFYTLEDETGWMDQVTLLGDNLYYISSEYDEAAQTGTFYLCSLAAGENRTVKSVLDIGKDTGVSKMFVTPDGKLQVLLLTYLYDDEESGKDGEDQTAQEEDNRNGSTDAVDETDDLSSEGTESSEADRYREPTAQKMELCGLSTDGKIISTVDISEVFENIENPNVQYAEMDKDQNIYLSVDQSVIVLDKDGKKLFDLKVDNWISNMFSTKDGTVMICYYGTEKMEIHPVDPVKKAVGSAETSMMVSDYGNYIFARGSESDILFSVENILYSYSLGDEAPVELLNWIDVDINSSELRTFAVLDDGRIFAVTSLYNHGENTSTELVYLTKKKGSEVPEKKILTYATMMSRDDEKKHIIEFNKTNREYRIEVKEYNKTDDWAAGLTQLNSDIVGGKCPDIIDLSYGTSKKYVAKGLLEDLNPYLENDPEIRREDYLENVLKAFETDGKLYGITPKIYIQTAIAKVSDVGERSSITLDELIDITENMPEGMDLYEYATKASILSGITMMNMDRFVDWSTGKCSFNDEEFIKLLEFSNTFPAEINYGENGPDTPSRIHENKLLMIMSSISSVQEYQMMEGMFGEPITFVGVPTDGDNGSFIESAEGILGMSSKSRNKEGVWQFLRSRIMKETQEDIDPNDNWGFPIMKSALEKKFEQDMTDDYYELPDGTKEKQAKTTWQYGDFSLEIFAATKEQTDTVRNLLQSVDKVYSYDQEINDIMIEETEAFFEGQKTAKDVADIIQSRVQIYVNENR